MKTNTDVQKLIKWGLYGTGVVIIIGYSYFVLNDFVRGPRIIIDTPKSGYSTTTPAIIISGRGIHTNNLAINGAQTAVDLDGNFRDQLILAPGYNIIKITAKDNYERVVEKTIEMVLVVPQSEEPTATTTAANISTDIGTTTGVILKAGGATTTIK